MNQDNTVLTRRLAGAAVLLLLAFGLSLILPDPSQPPQVEPGVQRVELRVADGSVIDPAEKARAKLPAGESVAPADAVDGNAPGVPQSLDMAVSPDVEMPSAAEDEPAPATASAPVASAPTKSLAKTEVPKPSPAPVRPAPAVPAIPTAAKAKPAETTVPVTKPPAAVTAKPPVLPPAAPAAPTPAPNPSPAVPIIAKVEPKPGVTIPVPPSVEPVRPAPAAVPKPTPTPAVAAAPIAAPAVPVTPAPGAAQAAVAKPAPAPAAPATPKGWLIQAGSYADIDNARQVQSQLSALGYSAGLSIIEAGGSARYRIRCGPFASREQAEAARQRLQQANIPASLVAEGG